MDSGKHFHELADAAPVLIWRAGVDKRCNWVNRPWLEFSGRPLDAELGSGWLDLVHPDDRDGAIAEFEGAFEERRSFFRDFRLRRFDGSYRWFADSGRPFYLADGSFGGYLGSSIDITERKEAEIRAEKALADATQALRQRDVLLAEVHHRVKNNLQVILSLLSLRSRSVEIPSSRSELDAISRRIQALAIVQQELHEDEDVSRIDIKRYITRLARPLAELHKCEHIEVKVTGVDALIELNRAGAIGFILAELISNCFGHAFGDGDGAVSIDVGGEPDRDVKISISDTGPGFDEGRLERPTGIGLRLVQSLAKQMDIALKWNTRSGAALEMFVPRETPGSLAAASAAHAPI